MNSEIKSVPVSSGREYSVSLPVGHHGVRKAAEEGARRLFDVLARDYYCGVYGSVTYGIALDNDTLFCKLNVRVYKCALTLPQTKKSFWMKVKEFFITDDPYDMEYNKRLYRGVYSDEDIEGVSTEGVSR